MTPVIAIDGPSGVGKGTVARGLARKLRWNFLDSGALYRILALAAHDAGVPLEKPERVAALASGLEIRFALEGDVQRILIGGEDQTARLRAETTGAMASVIAVFPPIRAALLERQRAFRQPPGLVADGRDMGTVVFPEAKLKVFLEASAEERARRRQLQLRESGISAILSNLCDEIRERDVRDRNRSHSPLKPAEDAVVIDTTELSVEAVLQRIETLANARGCATQP